MFSSLLMLGGVVRISNYRFRTLFLYFSCVMFRKNGSVFQGECKINIKLIFRNILTKSKAIFCWSLSLTPPWVMYKCFHLFSHSFNTTNKSINNYLFLHTNTKDNKGSVVWQLYCVPSNQWEKNFYWNNIVCVFNLSWKIPTIHNYLHCVLLSIFNCLLPMQIPFRNSFIFIFLDGYLFANKTRTMYFCLYLFTCAWMNLLVVFYHFARTQYPLLSLLLLLFIYIIMKFVVVVVVFLAK